LVSLALHDAPSDRALVARARLFIGCDTGPMHVAAALGRPVVALFGPADPRRTGPWGKGHAIVRVPPRMEDITVELVLRAARERLSA
jgi:ADP-heptose:LPS heptosyltransferase